MKLEYLPNGPNDSGLIRLYDYGSSEAKHSHVAFENCASSQVSWPLARENESLLTKKFGLPQWTVAN